MLTVLEVQYIAHRLAKDVMEWDEPIPAFETRFPHKLESCLLTPFQTWKKRHLYQGIYKKASILFYLLIKNHPFSNGNKRIAVTSLLVFLHKNGKWIDVDNRELYQFAVWVAESNPKVKAHAVAAIHAFLQSYIVEL